jgi:hypothetical protein
MMQIEIEKKYKLIKSDLVIIKKKCDFVNSKKITDIYLDSKNYDIFSA